MGEAAFPELEILLHQPQPGEYWAELRFFDPEDQAERAPRRARVPFDADKLAALSLEMVEYGAELSRQLFAGAEAEDLRSFFREARAVVDQRQVPLRLRLQTTREAASLQGLRWETLQDPDSRETLAHSERVLFSRFLFSSDWRPVGEARQHELRALVAVAAPRDLAKYKLAAVDAAGEIARVRDSLSSGSNQHSLSSGSSQHSLSSGSNQHNQGAIATSTLGDASSLTLEALVDALRPGVDILYLVCHGLLRSGESWLFFANAAGEAERVAGAELATRLRELKNPPRLVVLASCESGGRADGDTHGALALQLGAAGVSAVLAMQGQISMETAATLMPVFFRELCRDGQIDRALAVARGTVRERPDAWMPALYLRLKRGRLWYVPGFEELGEAAAGTGLERWQSIVAGVRKGSCVPIVGPDFGEHLFGDSEERARFLAQAAALPLPVGCDFAEVCQRVSLAQSREWLREHVKGGLRRALIERDAELAAAPKLYEAVAEKCLADPTDPYRLLADLELPVQVSAASDPLLLYVLAARGRKVKALCGKWRRTASHHPKEAPYEGVPTAELPVIAYPFGVFGKDLDDTLVLTEDDFLDYLIAATDYQLLPAVVRGTLVKSSLLFLGFQLDSLAFRVLFRLIVALEGSANLFDFAHIGVQVDPRTGSAAEARRVRRHLQDYFSQQGIPRVEIYWGSVADFLVELEQKLRETPTLATTVVEEDDDYLPGT